MDWIKMMDKMIMEKTTFIMAMTVTFLFVNCVQAGGSVVVNSSFENDGPIYPITKEDTPERWDDVNVPDDQFGGSVSSTWAIDGYYNLTLHSYRYVPFDANDKATVSQQVYLTDVNEISFYLKLETTPPSKEWYPEKRTPVLMIDEDVIWEPNDEGQDIVGEYFIGVNGIDYKGWHRLSLCIKSNIDDTFPLIKYTAMWDFIRFDAHCGGYGHLRADLTGPDGRRDCYVDEFDLKLLAENWLDENPAYRYDLFEDGDDIVNLRDFGVLAEVWMGDSYGQDNQLLAGDLNDDGIVNLLDFAIAAENYSGGQVDYNDISILAEQWLQKNWLYWPE